MRLGFASASLLLALSFSIALDASAQSQAGNKQQIKAATPVVSYFPKEDLGLFLAANFDLASIRSSFGPRRTPVLRTFANFGMKPSTATENALIFDEPSGWLYELKIVGWRDVNSDGVEDLDV